MPMGLPERSRDLRISRAASAAASSQPWRRHCFQKLEQAGKKVRTVYAHDQGSGLKLLAGDAWFVVDGNGKDASAYLLKADAQAQAAKVKGKVVDFDTLKGGKTI